MSNSTWTLAYFDIAVKIKEWEYWPLCGLIVLCVILFGFGMLITFILGNGKPGSANEIGDSAGQSMVYFPH